MPITAFSVIFPIPLSMAIVGLVLVSGIVSIHYLFPTKSR